MLHLCADGRLEVCSSELDVPVIPDCFSGAASAEMACKAIVSSHVLTL